MHPNTCAPSVPPFLRVTRPQAPPPPNRKGPELVRAGVRGGVDPVPVENASLLLPLLLHHRQLLHPGGAAAGRVRAKAPRQPLPGKVLHASYGLDSGREGMRMRSGRRPFSLRQIFVEGTVRSDAACTKDKKHKQFPR